jgi:hypothetical protein
VFELRRTFLDAAGDEFRGLHAVKIDFDRNLHCAFSLLSLGAVPHVARSARLSQFVQQIVYQ